MPLLGVPGRRQVCDPDLMRPVTVPEDPCARIHRRLASDERGVALVMAVLVMFVLSIVLTTVIFLTAARARDAQRTNAGQKAYALGESGINNALAVLNANYPGTTVFPGNPNLLLSTTLT